MLLFKHKFCFAGAFNVATTTSTAYGNSGMVEKFPLNAFMLRISSASIIYGGHGRLAESLGVVS